VSSPYNPYPQQDQPGGYGQPYQQYPQGGWDPSAQRGYLQGGPVGFGEAIAEAFKNAFTYSGRASRSAFWWFDLFAFIVYVVGVILEVALKGPGIAIAIILFLCLFVLSISLQVRRLHDTDRSGFWWFIGLVPFVGGIVLLVFDLLPGTPGPNRHG
jgi:uncharacterized membrane protein YhaH (DUF805 family)